MTLNSPQRPRWQRWTASISAWVLVVATCATVAWLAIMYAGREAEVSTPAARVGLAPMDTATWEESASGLRASGSGSGSASGLPGVGTMTATLPEPAGSDDLGSPSPGGTDGAAGSHDPTSPAAGSHTAPTQAPATSPSAGAGSSTRPSAPRSTARPSRAPAPAPNPSTYVASLSVNGGSLAVACTGSTLSLRWVTAKNGWRYATEREGAGLAVKFERVSGAAPTDGEADHATSDQQPTDQAPAGQQPADRSNLVQRVGARSAGVPVLLPMDDESTEVHASCSGGRPVFRR